MKTILRKGHPFIVIAILIAYIFLVGKCKHEIKQIEIPAQSGSTVIDNPIPEIRIDTIYTEAKGKKQIEKIIAVENPVNKELLQKYEQAMKDNDSLKTLSLYKDAVTERKYTETLEDSVQTITVKTEVIGTMKRQSINYITKEKTVEFKVEKARSALYVGGFSYLSINQADVPVFGVNVGLLNKTKKRMLTVGFDNEKRLHVGVSLKLF